MSLVTLLLLLGYREAVCEPMVHDESEVSTTV